MRHSARFDDVTHDALARGDSSFSICVMIIGPPLAAKYGRTSSMCWCIHLYVSFMYGWLRRRPLLHAGQLPQPAGHAAAGPLGADVRADAPDDEKVSRGCQLQEESHIAAPAVVGRVARVERVNVKVPEDVRLDGVEPTRLHLSEYVGPHLGRAARVVGTARQQQYALAVEDHRARVVVHRVRLASEVRIMVEHV